jgi:hypothetical protein
MVIAGVIKALLVSPAFLSTCNTSYGDALHNTNTDGTLPRPGMRSEPRPQLPNELIKSSGAMANL